jgi:hypothetical protein
MKLIGFISIFLLSILVVGCTSGVQTQKVNDVTKPSYYDGTLFIDINESFCNANLKYGIIAAENILGNELDVMEDIGHDENCDPITRLNLRIKEFPASMKLKICNKYMGCDTVAYSIDNSFNFIESDCEDCEKELNLIEDIAWCNEGNEDGEKINSYTIKFSCKNPVFPKP